MRYLARARSSDRSPNPWGWVALMVLAPVVTWLLASRLLAAINIDGPQAAEFAGTTHKAVRTAIQQTLTVEITAERMQSVLLATQDPGARPAAKPDQAAETRRKAERTEQVKPASTRLSGDVAALTDALVVLALPQHPSADQAKSKPRKTVEEVVDSRLTDAAVGERVRIWVAAALDTHSRAQAEKALPKGSSIAQVISGTIEPARLRANVKRAITPALDSFDVRIGAPIWSADINGRLAWAIAALVFCLAWTTVVLYATIQIATIESPHRWIVGVPAILLAVIGVAVVASRPSATTAPLPLMTGLETYAGIYRVGMLSWASLLNVLTVIGATALVAGSIATLWVDIKEGSQEELDEQLAGLRSLFNAGSILLLAGVLEVYALLRWPLAFIADDASRAAMQSVAATYAAAIGAMFSIVLLGIYIPATIAIRRQALARKIPAKQVSESLSKVGFGDLTSQQLARLTQALLPLLPGVITVVT